MSKIVSTEGYAGKEPLSDQESAAFLARFQRNVRHDDYSNIGLVEVTETSRDYNEETEQNTSWFQVMVWFNGHLRISHSDLSSDQTDGFVNGVHDMLQALGYGISTSYVWLRESDDSEEV